MALLTSDALLRALHGRSTRTYARAGELVTSLDSSLHHESRRPSRPRMNGVSQIARAQTVEYLEDALGSQRH